MTCTKGRNAMSDEKLGTDQIKKVVDALVEAGNVAGLIAADKGNFLQRATYLMRLSDEAIGLASLDVKALRAQFADLDDQEKAELVAHAKDKFDLADDVLEAKIEAGFDLVEEVGVAIKANYDLVKKVAAFLKPAAPAAPVAG